MARSHTRFLALLTTAAVLSPATAYAGPDDGKRVVSQAHVDSPKTFWENNSFVLKTEYAEKATPLAENVAWVGKGWSSKGDAQYQFALPENGSMDFVGRPGEVYYSAPSLPSGSHDPIWLGFGADSLPTEKLRDGSASLDLLSVDGPGEIEMFRYFEDFAEAARMLGTSKGSPHSAFLTAGTHTHNYTLFSKPGRYELTYRTTARGRDGSIIASEPTTTSIQVGGQRPSDKPTPSLRERFDAAHAGSSEELAKAGYHLRVEPKKGPSRDGDEHLSTITLDTRGSTKPNGTLTLLIDGYFLTDLSVKNGQAQWEEFLGPKDAELQAVFTPEGEAPRWISEPLHYSSGAQLQTDSSRASETWQETSAPRNLAPQDPVEITDTGFKARLEPLAEGLTKVVIDTADKNFRGFVQGGTYSVSEDGTVDTGAYTPFDAFISDGHAEFLLNDEALEENMAVGVDVVSHPLMSVGSAAPVYLTKNYQHGKTYTASGALGTAAQDGPHQEATPSTAPTAQPTPSAKHEPERCSEKVTLDKGHVDIKAAQEGEAFSAVVKDETFQVDQKTVDRPVDQVILAVGENARVKRGSELAGKDFEFLGKPGDHYYLLPQTQNRDIIWPGYNTQALDYKQFKDGVVNLKLKPQSMPAGGDFALFLTKDFGGVNLLASSATKDYAVETTFASHTHTNWVFNKPGVYKLELSYEATTKDGKQVSSQPQVLTIAVGDKAREDAQKDCDAQAPQSPEPSTQPTEPTTKPSEPNKPSEPKKPESSAKQDRILGGVLSLAVPLALAVIFQAVLSFQRDHRAEIERWLSGLLGR
ncbi:choice-of-anchor M domain-containing protein [Corynebacterium sp.]|uniref:choice-of-anchor M domain-containing protein n=1 Tax=Corynebacterium sp. TaxID=1720 RepID=UPI0026DB60A4|nr:choice-of-anchor M domain-containing protein [Corynebacterium sp.]MDO5031485.1 choice-of-anchor M domain-containing protein [Corynebacterium sp.]